MLGLFAAPFLWIALLVLGLYFAIAVSIAIRQPSSAVPGLARVLLPFGFLLWHVSYGIGALAGGAKWIAAHFKKGKTE